MCRLDFFRKKGGVAYEMSNGEKVVACVSVCMCWVFGLNVRLVLQKKNLKSIWTSRRRSYGGETDAKQRKLLKQIQLHTTSAYTVFCQCFELTHIAASNAWTFFHTQTQQAN